MKVLFISSGNSIFDVTPNIEAQGKSLQKQGINVDYYLIKGKGLKGYWKGISNLKKYISQTRFDLIHAHYSLSGLLANLTCNNLPVVISFLGSDLNGIYNKQGKLKLISYFIRIISFFVQYFAQAIIVKSNKMTKYILLKKKMHIIPNGVDIVTFNEFSDNHNNVYRKPIVLFLGSTKDYGKNFKLLQFSLEQSLKKDEYELLAPYPIKQSEVVQYLNMAHVLVLTSLNEGSPNIIKEAMACNCPIVSTDVGDVKWLLDGLEGCFITSFDPSNVADNISKALKFSKENGRTKGREKLISLGLDSESVARRIIQVYKSVLAKG